MNSFRSTLLMAAVFSATAAEAGAAAPADPSSKRRLSMNQFASKMQHAEMGLAYEKLVAAGKAGEVASLIMPIGQIIGEIYEVNEVIGRLPDGSEKSGLQAIGNFEACIYSTGEVFETNTAYLPEYFLKVAKAALAKSGISSLEFAVEVLLVPTGKQIPTAYEVRNLRSRPAESAINRMKMELEKRGIPLRVSAPVALALEDLRSNDQPIIEGVATAVIEREASLTPEPAAVEQVQEQDPHKPDAEPVSPEDPDAPELEPEHTPAHTETPELQPSDSRRKRA